MMTDVSITLPLEAMEVSGNPLSMLNTPHSDFTHRKKEQEEVEAILSRLDDVRFDPRLPLVSTVCTCEAVHRHIGTNRSYDSEESDSDTSSSNCDEDDFSLAQILKAIDLYLQRPVVKRKISIMTNLIAGYSCKEHIEDETVLKLLDLAENNDPQVQMTALQVVAKLCCLESNTFKFLFHDSLTKMLSIISQDNAHQVQEAAALVIKEICVHHSLEDMWMDSMLSVGLSVLLGSMVLEVPLPVRYAVAQALTALASYHSIAMLILDHGMPAVNMMKTLHSDFKEQYTLILTQLVLHSDHTQAEILDEDALPSALYMLRQGPCRPQSQSLVFLSALAHTETGIKAILDGKATPYIFSALLDTKCRKVEEFAACAVNDIFASSKSAFQKQILVQVDNFFHGHEEQPLLGHGRDQTMITQNNKPKLDASSRVQRALQDIIDALISRIEKGARIEKNLYGKIIQVNLAPSIDVDPVSLATMKHLVSALSKLAQYKVVKIKLKNMNIRDVDESEVRLIWRQSVGSVNPMIGQMLIDSGVTCVLDILHTYTVKFHQTFNVPLPLPKEASIGGTNVHLIMEAWSHGSAIYDRRILDCKPIFDENEITFISSLLSLILLLAQCSAKVSDVDVEKQVKEKIKMAENRMHSDPQNGDISSQCNHSNPVKVKKKNKLRGSVTLDGKLHNNGRIHRCLCCKEKQVPPEPKSVVDNKQQLTMKGQEFALVLDKTLSSIRRQLRMSLYEGGVLEATGPWLLYIEKDIKVRVFKILQYMIRPLEERLMPRPPKPQVQNGKQRPISAMTVQERERKLNTVICSMSTKTSDFVLDALSTKPPINNTRSENIHPQTIKDFAREIKLSGVLGDKTDSIIVNLLKSLEDNSSRPESARSTLVRPDSGKAMNSLPRRARQIGHRPASAKAATGQNGAEPNIKTLNKNWSSSETNLTLRSNSAQKARSRCLKDRPRSATSEAALSSQRSVRSATSDRKQNMRVWSGLSDKSSAVRLDSAKSASSDRTRSSSARPRKAVEEIIHCLKKLGPLPWRPSCDLCQPIALQCRQRLLEVCGKDVLSQMFSKEEDTKKATLVFLEEFVRHSEVCTQMKLSEYGIMSKLVDFLRVNEDQQLLEIIGLIVSRLLISSDPRLRQAFDVHGGTDLLAVMARYTSGPLKEEVNVTLKTTTRVHQKSPAKEQTTMARPGGLQRNPTLDIWDEILLRWTEEDKVMLLLRKDVI